jgi:hypothetical protein
MLLKQNNKPFQHQTDFADLLSRVSDSDLDAYARDLVDRYPSKAKRLKALLNRELNNGRHYPNKYYYE